MAKIKTVREIPLEKFSWNKDTKTLTTEASTLGSIREGTWWMHQIYDDACDTGITIRSHYTGKDQTFYLTKELYQGRGEDRELVGWEFAPVDKKCKAKKVVIFWD